MEKPIGVRRYIAMANNPMNRPCKGEHLVYVDGDGVETETWECDKCGAHFSVPIEIKRHWDEAEEEDV